MVERLRSLNKVLRLIVIGLLLFRLTPIGSETAEALIAMVSDGDQVPDQDADPEHGCTTLVHHCGCHSIAGVLRDPVIAMAPPNLVGQSVFVLSTPLLEPDARALLRPPAA